MALSVFVGSLTAPASTGNQAYTGGGFTPAVVLFFSSGQSSDATAAHAELNMGVGISASERRSVWDGEEDGVGTTDVNTNRSTTRCVGVLTPATGVVVLAADLVSLDADGFTLNWVTTSSGIIVNYLALGGADLTNVKLGDVSIPTTTGSSSVTGVGFQPDCVLLFASRNDTGGNAKFALGGATSSSSRACIAVADRDSQSASRGSKRQLTNRCFTQVNGFISAPGAIINEADFVSFNADGFTLNWVTVDTTVSSAYYLALKGGNYKVGNFTQKTSTGTQAITTDFTPTGLLLWSFANTATSDETADWNLSLGFASSPTARAILWSGVNHGSDPIQADKRMDRTKIMHMMTPGATPSTEATADLDSFNSTDFTLNWSVADATAREICYVVVGSAGAPTPTARIELPILGVGA